MCEDRRTLLFVEQSTYTKMRYTPQDGFPYYFSLVQNSDVRSLFASPSTFTYLESIDEEESTRRYAQGKWSIKQVVGHIADHERIKIFRAFLLSRNELVELWGYDQNKLVANSCFDALSWREIIDDFQAVRNSSRSFVNLLSDDQMKIKGSAGQHEISLEGFLKSIIGHEFHHLKVIKEKYN
jgi:uncharacterized damage-inducible protein DinB